MACVELRISADFREKPANAVNPSHLPKNAAADEVTEKEERVGGLRLPSVSAHEVKLRHQCLGGVRPPPLATLQLAKPEARVIRA